MRLFERRFGILGLNWSILMPEESGEAAGKANFWVFQKVTVQASCRETNPSTCIRRSFAADFGVAYNFAGE
jgi:hypothetical protein